MTVSLRRIGKLRGSGDCGQSDLPVGQLQHWRCSVEGGGESSDDRLVIRRSVVQSLCQYHSQRRISLRFPWKARVRPGSALYRTEDRQGPLEPGWLRGRYSLAARGYAADRTRE